MNGCENCMHQKQPEYCELNNKKLYGFCGNFTSCKEEEPIEQKGGAE